MSLQIKPFYSITGGYSGEEQGVLSTTLPSSGSWTDVTNGTWTSEYFYRDSVQSNNGLSSRVVITIIDKITNFQYNCTTNTVTFHLHTEITKVVRDDYRGGTSGSNWQLSIYDRKNGTLLKTIDTGKQQATGTKFSGTIVVNDKDVTLAHGATYSDTSTVYVTNYYTNCKTTVDKCTDYINCGVSLRNTYPQAPGTPDMSVSCSVPNNNEAASKGIISISNVNYNCPSGNPCSNKTSVVVSKSSDYSNPVYSTSFTDTSSHTFYPNNLSPNTKYYTKTTTTNGYNCAGVTNTRTRECQFTTLATNSLASPTYVNNTRSTVTLNVNNGGGACTVTTKVYYRLKGASNWTQLTSVTSTGTKTINIRNIFEKGNTYEIKAESTNCAGTYTGNVVTLTMPADGVSGVITSAYAWVDSGEITARAKVCYTVEGQPTPVIYHLEYRAIGTTTWEVSQTHTSDSETTQTCEYLSDLAPDTCYEFRTYQQAGDVDSYSPIYSTSKTCTPSILPTECYICENLDYMTELICQQSKHIEHGLKTLYSNDDTLEFCDPENPNPTFASMWARVLRFYHASACLACDMSSMSIDAGEDNQIWTGDIGWNDIDTSVSEDSENLVTSDATATYIDEFIHSIFHPIGSYNYIADTVLDLPREGVSVGDTGIVGDKVYTFSGPFWPTSGVPIEHLDNFGVISITKGEFANKEFYYLNNSWNILDANTKDLESRADELESTVDRPVKSYQSAKKYSFVALPNSYTDDQLLIQMVPACGLSDKDIIIYLTEDI